jgi:glycerophosphoryl diester phosphodiesterase
VLAAARGFGLERVLVTSFQDAVIREVKRRESAVTAGLLLGLPRPARPVRTRLSELFPGRRLRACKADVVVPHARLLKLGFTARARLAGVPVLVWTVNERAALAALLDRVDGLVTDEPAACLALRAGPRPG